MTLRALLIVPALLLATSVSVTAQTAPGEQRPDDLTVAPIAPNSEAETAQSGGQANICQELMAFVEKEAAEQNKEALDKGKLGAEQASSNPAAQGNASREGETKDKLSGQTAPPVDSPQHRSGQTAPIPNSGTEVDATSAELARAKVAAGGGDLLACRDAAQRLRRSGLEMPPGLIALAAMKPENLQSSP